ncbi:MAG: AMP-binding protein, partial [Burkholderiales bacterium]
MNLVQLLLRSARWLPERPALALGATPVRSYREMAQRVSRIASGFQKKLNLQPGDRVAIAMKNCPEFYEVLFACWHAGMTA